MPNKDLPKLECDKCGNPTSANRENKDGSIHYVCRNSMSHEDFDSHSWTVMEDGSLKEPSVG